MTAAIWLSLPFIYIGWRLHSFYINRKFNLAVPREGYLLNTPLDYTSASNTVILTLIN